MDQPTSWDQRQEIDIGMYNVFQIFDMAFTILLQFMTIAMAKVTKPKRYIVSTSNTSPTLSHPLHP